MAISYIEDNLEPGEQIIYQAHVRLVAYITALLYFAGLMMPGRLTGLASTELALTNKRVIGKVGMFRRKKLSLPHKDIEVVMAQRGLTGLMFDYGALTISGKNGMRVKFRGLARPHEMEKQIDEAVEIAVLGRSLHLDDGIKIDMPADNMNDIHATRPALIVTKDAPPFEAAAVAKAIIHHKDPNVW